MADTADDTRRTSRGELTAEFTEAGTVDGIPLARHLCAVYQPGGVPVAYVSAAPSQPGDEYLVPGCGCRPGGGPVTAGDDDEVEVTADPALRQAAIFHAAAFVAGLYGIDVTLDGDRDVPRTDYTRILLTAVNPLVCTVEVNGQERSFWWLFTEADVPEILEIAAGMIDRWTAAGEQWGVSGD